MFYLALAIYYLAFVPFIFFAPSLIHWSARAYAWFYPTEQSRKMADRLFFLSKWFWGVTMSEFIVVASERPETFVWQIWLVRLLGLIPWIVATCILIYMS
jgi:hypothetical protein